MPPGSRLLAFASRWFDEQTVATVFQPLIADLQQEWSAADAGQRRRVALRGRLAFIVAVIAAYPRVLRTPTPSLLVRRVAMRLGVFYAIASVICAQVLLQDWGAQVPDASVAVMAALVLLALVPVLTMALPFAMAFAVDPIRSDPTLPPAVVRSAMMKLLAATTLWMVIGGGWIVPATEQVWRTALVAAAAKDTSGYVPPRGARELSTWELAFHSERAFVPDRSHTSAAARELARRAAFIVLPFLAAWFRWRTPKPTWPNELLLFWIVGARSLFGLGPIGIGVFVLIPVYLAAYYLRDRRDAGDVSQVG